jgi:hypothetical protein
MDGRTDQGEGSEDGKPHNESAGRAGGECLTKKSLLISGGGLIIKRNPANNAYTSKEGGINIIQNIRHKIIDRNCAAGKVKKSFMKEQESKEPV